MNKTIARNIKKIKEIARYTQDEVAQVLGITRSAYSNYEPGNANLVIGNFGEKARRLSMRKSIILNCYIKSV